MPLGKIPKGIRNLLNNVNIYDYGLKIQSNFFKSSHTGCILDKPYVLMYTLALSAQSSAKRILLTGIDGYSVDNYKQQEMIDCLSKFVEQNNNLKIYSITPTTYPIKTIPLNSLN